MMKVAKSIEVKVVNGNSKEFFLTIAPIILSRNGSNYFNGLPVVTSENHIWHLIVVSKDEIAFACTEQGKNFSIRYIYVQDTGKHDSSYRSLITSIIPYFDKSDCGICSASSKSKDVHIWKKLGFEALDGGKNWTKVILKK